MRTARVRVRTAGVRMARVRTGTKESIEYDTHVHNLTSCR